MKRYETANIRNIALIGPKGVGKTSFLEAALFTSKATVRFGKVDEGNSILDSDPVEIERKQSILSKFTPVEWKGCKINMIDTPGYMDFVGEVVASIAASDVCLVVVDAAHGVDVAAKRADTIARNMNKPRAYFINKVDFERADCDAVLAAIKDKICSSAALFQIPIGVGSSFRGVVDLMNMRAYINEGGNQKELDVPADMIELAKEKRTLLMEAVAESDEDLLAKYLDTGELSEEDMKRAMAKGIAAGQISPVFIGSSITNSGIDAFLNAVVSDFPSPADMPAVKVKRIDGSEVEIKMDSNGPLVAHVFKTTSDPGIGDVFYFKIYSGHINPGDDVYNITQSGSERMGHLIATRGKDRIDVESAAAGDIVAVAKLKNTFLNDTLTTKTNSLIATPIEFPNPVVSMAVIPRSKKDQDKLGIGLSKLTSIDTTLTYHIDKEFSETIVTAMGEIQIDVLVKRLFERYNVEVDIGKPHIPYREKITKKSEKQGKHKKQSGGHGQFGDCWLRLEPLPVGGGFEFVDAIVGGSIPGKYLPAVEKGVRDAMHRGTLAGYPVVDLRVTVYDGSYHDVDSSDMAFQIAGVLAFKNAMADASPQLLEPIVDLEVYAPQDNMGDLSSDISQRRGRVTGMDNGIIHAKVPMAELYQYSASLKSITRGAGTFSMRFSHYDPVPSHIAQKVIDETKREKEEKIA